jgi:hypothetical protein
VHRFARCKSIGSAWDLADFLTAHVHDCKFEVRMPSRTDIEVWAWTPLPPAEQEQVKRMVAAYRNAKLAEQAAAGSTHESESPMGKCLFELLRRMSLDSQNIGLFSFEFTAEKPRD